MEEKYEVLAANVAFLGQTFPKGTVITKSDWKVQADAWNEKKAAATPTLDVNAIFEHLMEREIIKLVETKVVVDEETKIEIEIPVVKKGRKEKR